MEKLFNWTIGSFFRTIGRLIAYFAIGAFIAYILGTSNIKLPFGISELFLDHVEAMSLDGILDREIATGPNDYQFFLWDYGLGGGANTYRFEQEFDFDVPFTPNGATYAVFPIEGITYTIGDLKVSDFQIKIYLKSDKNYAMCELQNNLITCGLDQARTYTGIKFWLRPITYFANNEEWDVEYRVNRNVSLYKTDTQSIIDNQNQNHNETMTVIYDTNTTQEQNETTSLFEDFQFSSESSGLVGVVTAPLRVINSISQGTFSDLCFTLKNKNVCLPNGNIIWQKSSRTSIKGITPNWFGSGSISTGIQSFVTLFNLVVGGFLFYKMGCSIKRMVEELINPTDTRIEVMKL